MAELTGAAPGEVGKFIRQAQRLARIFDGIHLAGAETDQAEVSSTALAALLLRESIDVTPALTCRDRNRIALQSEILGLRALGVTSMVLKRGSRNPNRDGDPSGAVFDASGPELIAMARDIDETGLLLGTTAKVPAEDSDFSPSDLLEGAAAGARFLKIDPCTDLSRLRHYMARLVDDRITWQYSVLLSIEPLEQGVAEAAEWIRQASSIPGVSGVNLVCGDDPEAAIAALTSSGVLADS
jgi:methylenetetrahydrofolate reductase (NADPH)